MKVTVIKLMILAVVSLLLLAACAEAGDPVDTVESYLNARVESDADELQQLSCAQWESQALLQADSFRSMDASIEDMSCQKDGEDGDFTLVACDGRIVTSYNGETREWDLPDYQLVEEDGEWKICGEAQ